MLITEDNDEAEIQKLSREKAMAQYDALQLGSGWDERDITKPQILIEDVYGDSHPEVSILIN